MVRVFVRRSRDATYLTSDAALELDGVRDGAAGWWVRGGGDSANPREVERVFTSSARSSVVGYDIVVAAPRPISILVALDSSHARGVVSAHRVSVAASIDYLEERALLLRDRRDGDDRDVPARWQEILSYTHGVNRHGEPHLHDHVLVGARPRDASTVLDGRSLFAHVGTADALYRSSLRHELGRRTPWAAWRSFSGVEHVRDLDEGYRALWGGHYDERGDKRTWARDEVVAKWLADERRFEPHGVVPSPRVRASLDEHGFAAAFEGRFDVARRHVVAAWADAAVFGQSARDVVASVDRLYPGLGAQRGVRETTISVDRARMLLRVREHGERPLLVDDLERWDQRSRGRSRSDLSR